MALSATKGYFLQLNDSDLPTRNLFILGQSRLGLDSIQLSIESPYEIITCGSLKVFSDETGGVKRRHC